MWKIVTTPEFEKRFRKIVGKNKDLARRVAKAILKLENNPHCGKQLMYNLAGLWSLRVGKFRIIYEIDENSKEIILRSIGHRNRIYSQFP